MNPELIAGLILGVLVFVAIYVISKIPVAPYEPPQKRAGRLGEEYATRKITSVLNSDDTLLTNVKVDFEGKETELDNVIVNKYGVFIIEVKYYHGWLKGGEDDYEWTQYKETYSDMYIKTVKNPIKQVKRQVYIVANYLREYGVNVWVDGYALMVDAGSPVESDMILTTTDEIDRVIHTVSRRQLNKESIEEIVALLTTSLKPS
ncbi:MAG: NERD domain-containing protein [Oscillospiraceae bacterium]|nr:NERD domain-containing protein [Oscillospiraceae bacterium]